MTEHQIRNPHLGSQLPRLGSSAGLTVQTVVPLTVAFTDRNEADEVLGFLRVTERAVAQDLMTAAESRRWLDHLASGYFFASVTQFLVVARRSR